MQGVRRSQVIGSKGKRRIVVRERYLRSDLSCRSSMCTKCEHHLPALLSSSSDFSYIIPDYSCVLQFIEILVSFLCRKLIAIIYMMIRSQLKLRILFF